VCWHAAYIGEHRQRFFGTIMNRTDRTFHTETGSETAIRDTH
jgi:hypothetical protein